MRSAYRAPEFGDFGRSFLDRADAPIRTSENVMSRETTLVPAGGR